MRRLSWFLLLVAAASADDPSSIQHSFEKGVRRGLAGEPLTLPQIVFATLLYFLPTVFARKKRNFAAIFAFNFLLGWTIIGWIVALIWSLTADAPVH